MNQEQQALFNETLIKFYRVWTKFICCVILPLVCFILNLILSDVINLTNLQYGILICSATFILVIMMVKYQLTIMKHNSIIIALCPTVVLNNKDD